MAQAVVDRLEAVDIEQQQAPGLPGVRAQGLGGPALEGAAVEDAGEGIALGQPRHRLLPAAAHGGGHQQGEQHLDQDALEQGDLDHDPLEADEADEGAGQGHEQRLEAVEGAVDEEDGAQAVRGGRALGKRRAAPGQEDMAGLQRRDGDQSAVRHGEGRRGVEPRRQQKQPGPGQEQPPPERPDPAPGEARGAVEEGEMGDDEQAVGEPDAEEEGGGAERREPAADHDGGKARTPEEQRAVAQGPPLEGEKARGGRGRREAHEQHGDHIHRQRPRATVRLRLR